MNIKNFKINSGIQKVLAGSVTFALVGSMAAFSLSYPTKTDKNMLKGTILDGAVVITLSDGRVILARQSEKCETSKYGYHYEEIETGSLYATDDCKDSPIRNDRVTPLHMSSSAINKVPFEKVEDVTVYLTDDEVEALKIGTMTQEMLSNLTERITKSSLEDVELHARALR